MEAFIAKKVINGRQTEAFNLLPLKYPWAYDIYRKLKNANWSPFSSAVVDLIKKDQELLYVPYDFDLSGLVNARYALPDPSLHIKKVTRRLYRGFCIEEPTLRSAIRTVRSHETDFKRVIDNLPDISMSELKNMHRFLDRFFKEANDEDKMLKSFEQRCHD